MLVSLFLPDPNLIDDGAVEHFCRFGLIDPAALANGYRNVLMKRDVE